MTSNTQLLYNRAKFLIPGGTQLLSKRPELHLPEGWPPYYKKAAGCRVWDLDGKEYIDMSTMGIGACILGYADPDVNRAVKEAIDDGSMSSLNAPEEVACAELLISLHPWVLWSVSLALGRIYGRCRAYRQAIQERCCPVGIMDGMVS